MAFLRPTKPTHTPMTPSGDTSRCPNCGQKCWGLEFYLPDWYRYEVKYSCSECGVFWTIRRSKKDEDA